MPVCKHNCMLWPICLSKTAVCVRTTTILQRLPTVITAALGQRQSAWIAPAAVGSSAAIQHWATAPTAQGRAQASACAMAPKRKGKELQSTEAADAADIAPAVQPKRARRSSAVAAKAAAGAADAAQHAVKHAAAAVEAAAAGSPEATPRAKRAKGAAMQAMSEAAVAAAAANPALCEKAQRIAAQLAELYPLPPIPLDHRNPFQLLVAVMLSAQSTDKKVNEISPALFKVAPDAESLAKMEVEQVKPIIKAIGLANNKAKHLVGMAKMLVEKHGGEVPSTFEELEALPGVGHKTASVIMCQAFGKPAFPVDTHIHRLAQRWGLTNGKSVEQTEADLKALFPEQEWYMAHLQIIYFGREHCSAQSHQQATCPICSWAADSAGPQPLKVGQKRAKAPEGDASDAASPTTAARSRPKAADRTAGARLMQAAAGEVIDGASAPAPQQLQQFAFNKAAMNTQKQPTGTKHASRKAG